MEANLGKSLKEAAPDLNDKAARQMGATVAIMEKRGIKVHRLEEVTDDENAYVSGVFPSSVVQMFPRNPMLVIGNRFIETELFLPRRCRERFGVRKAVASGLAGSNAQYVAMPATVPMPKQEAGTVSGRWKCIPSR